MNKLKRILSVFVIAMMLITNLNLVSATETEKIDLNGGEYNGYKYEFEVEGLNSSYKWTGKPITPEIKVKQIKTKLEGEQTEETNPEETETPVDPVSEEPEVSYLTNNDYDVEYKNNVNVGTASVIIKGINDYTGQIPLQLQFKIVKNTINVKVSNINITSATISFSKLSNVKYSVVVKYSGKKSGKIKTNKSNYSVSGLKAGTKYTVEVTGKDSKGKVVAYGTKSFTTQKVVGKVTLSSVKAGNEMAQVNWKAVSGAKGYQIYRATSKNGKYTKVKTVSSKTRSYTNYLLTAKKTYYYKVRAYKTINGKTVYGSFSTVKSAKIKNATNKTYYLRVNTRTNVTTAYAKNFSGKYVAVKALTTSCGTRGQTNAILGTHYTIAKYKWKYMHENCYTQYATRIVGHYLFHSVPYSKPQSNTLWYNSYNKLGNYASSGCVRLRVIDAKWIYDHCPLKTKVIVTYSKTDPLKKQKIARINTRSKYRSWDPSDPNPKNPWKK